MKNLFKTIISIVLIIVIVFSIGVFYNNIQKQYDEYVVVENKANPEDMQKRIVVLENCESGKMLTKEVLNRTAQVILYKEGKIIKVKE